MRGNRLFIRSTGALAIFAMALLVSGIAASQERVLHSFGNGTDGQFPYLASSWMPPEISTARPFRAAFTALLTAGNGVRVDSQWGRQLDGETAT